MIREQAELLKLVQMAIAGDLNQAAPGEGTGAANAMQAMQNALLALQSSQQSKQMISPD